MRAELIEVLHLRDCWFATGAASTCRPSSGAARSCPADGVAISVDAPGRHFGHLVCIPAPETGVSGADRRAAVALAEVLGLSLGAAGRSGGSAWSPR